MLATSTITYAEADKTPKESYVVGEGEIDLQRGTFLYSNKVVSIGPEGSELVLQQQLGRTFQSEFGRGGGHNMTYTIERRYFREPDTAPEQRSNRFIVNLGGRTEVFEQYWSENYAHIWNVTNGKLAPGKLEILGPITQFGGPYQYTNADGTIVQFGVIEQSTGLCAGLICSYATSLMRPDGTRLDFSYATLSSGTKRLQAVANNRGYVLGFEYSYVPSFYNMPITKVCAANRVTTEVILSDVCQSSTLTASYTYNFSSSLAGSITFTDVMGDSTVFNFTGGEVASIIPPGSTTPIVSLQYIQPSGRVSRQDYADGTFRTYAYSNNPDPTYFPDIKNTWTEVTGPGVGTRRYDWWADSTLSNYRDELQRSTAMTYSWLGAIAVQTAQTLPDGNQVTYSYGQQNYAPDVIFGRNQPIEIRYKAKPGSGLADRVISRTYLPSIITTNELYGGPLTQVGPFCTIAGACDNPVSETDSRGGVTNWTYDPVHAGVLKKTLPADANGIRPETRYAYAQKYAWLRSGSGYVQAAHPIWVLSSEEYCRTSAADANGNCAAGASDEVVTNYQYEQGSATKGSNVLLLGTAVTADNQTLRTCYTYDSSGRRVSETQPLGTGSSCP